jgi:transposase
MKHLIAQSVGVDISKDRLDVALRPAGQTAQFPNDPDGHQALIKWLAGFTVVRITFEATGAYHRLFERTLDAAGLPMVKVNPRQARRFAEATGKLAKTDSIDAKMLAHMGEACALEPSRVVSQAIDEMRGLLSQRDALVKDRVAALTRQKTAWLPLVKGQLAKRLKQIDADVEAIDKQMTKARDADPQLAAKAEILTGIPGVGDVTANALLVEMPELGTLGQGEAASLAGLAPMARDSGKSAGKRHIRGGRARLRQALYMPALVCTRFNPEFKAKYKALLKAGKLKKVALTAIMRKLIILANALLRDNRKWTKNAARQPGENAEAGVSKGGRSPNADIPASADQSRKGPVRQQRRKAKSPAFSPLEKAT